MYSRQPATFFEASARLSGLHMPPTILEEKRLTFGGCGNRIDTIALGRMLAQVTIVPADVDRVVLVAYDSDRQMLAAVRGQAENGTLKLDGEIPFESSNVRGDTLVIGNLTITSASFSQSLIEGSDGSIIIDGRKVDFDRAVRFALLVPSTVNVTVLDEFIGAVGISDSLDGELTFKPSTRAQLTAGNVRSLTANVSGLSALSVASVAGNATIIASANSRVMLGEVRGKADIKARARAGVSINGIAID